MLNKQVTKKDILNFISRWAPAIAVMLAIFILSSTTGKTINDAGLGKESYHVSGHFLMFFVLCIAFYKATKNIVLSIVLSIVFACTDEYHQLYTLGRSASYKDIATDSLAALVAGGLVWKLSQKLPAKLKSWLAN